MADIFSTNVMMGVVQSLINPPQFLLDRFFPLVQTETGEEIHFDTIVKARRLAPFVSPLVEGKIVAGHGYRTSTFKPAYIKDKRVFDGNRAFKRSAGERIGGDMTPIQRQSAILAYELQDQMQNLERRFEWMAAQVLTTGKVTVTGDLYPAAEVDFGRDSSLTFAKSGGQKWSDAGINPLNDLQAWALLVLKLVGAQPVDVIMDLDAWKYFKDNTVVQLRLSTQRRLGEMPPMTQAAQISEGGVDQGTIDNFNIYTYATWYIDDNGTEQPMLPSGTVIMASPQIQGVRAFGSIRDEMAGFQSTPYYPKSWVENDPPLRYLMMQSAPLMVPTRPNASLCATVL